MSAGAASTRTFAVLPMTRVAFPISTPNFEAWVLLSKKPNCYRYIQSLKQSRNRLSPVFRFMSYCRFSALP